MIRFLKLTICLIFSILIPQSKKILVFGDRAGIRFTDNSRYLFFYYNLFLKDVRCIWLTKDPKIQNYLKKKGFESYISNSLTGLYFGLRASWHIFNYSEEDTSAYSGKFRKNINLFHGCAIKNCNRKYFKNNENFKDKNLFYTFFNNLRFKTFKTFFVFPNSKKSFIPWQSWMQYFPENKCSKLIVSNLQRNIMMNNNHNLNLNFFRTDKEIDLIKELDLKKKKIIGYFPTFRFNSKELFIDEDNEEKFNYLNEFLEKNNCIILIKKHQNSYYEDKNKFYDPKYDMISRLSNYKNIIGIDYDIDLASIMSLCDTVISDYSSLMMDYLYLNKGIIIYAPDIENYSKFPGLALDLKNQKFAYSAKNFDQLLKILEKFNRDEEHFHQIHALERLNLKKKVFENDESFKTIIDFIDKY